jgi:hypothetical protein
LVRCAAFSDENSERKLNLLTNVSCLVGVDVAAWCEQRRLASWQSSAAMRCGHISTKYVVLAFCWAALWLSLIAFGTVVIAFDHRHATRSVVDDKTTSLHIFLLVVFLFTECCRILFKVALRTLGQIAENTGFVIEPFVRYPRLLDILLTLVKVCIRICRRKRLQNTHTYILQGESQQSLRLEVLRVLGILGALDPYKHRQVRRPNALAATPASHALLVLVVGHW